MEQQDANKAVLLAEFEAARLGFHALLASLSDEELQHASRNPAWTNQQILFHMALGFFLLPSLILLVLLFGRLPAVASQWFAAILNAVVGPFNVINAFGPKAGANVFSRVGLAQIFDWVHGFTMKLVQALPEAELARGMYYPERWDSLFRSYMTLAEIIYFSMIHFYFHVGQIATNLQPLVIKEVS
jgi:hypothetical protein